MKKRLDWLLADRKRWLALLGLVVGLCLLCAGLAPRAAETSATDEERRLAAVLSAIEGAGRVEVIVQRSTAASAGWGDDGGSSVPTGAIVVAEGGADVGVRMALIRALRTLLGLPESAVDVFIMEELP